MRLGTMITPVSRMRPWKLASETIALDHLSGGRLVLSVGLGSIDNGFEAFGEETDRRVRAELLDEGLDILTGLWKGQPFRYNGKHYKIQRETLQDTTDQILSATLANPETPDSYMGSWTS